MLSIPVPRRTTFEDPVAFLAATSEVLATMDLDEETIQAGMDSDETLRLLGLSDEDLDVALDELLREDPIETLASIGRPGDSTGPQRRLFRYWTKGIGGRLKIRWGTHGSFRRCVRHLSKYVGARYSVKGLCANLHKRATGEWPREHGKAGIPS